MPYSNVTGRADTAALVPEDVSNAMLGKVDTYTSAARQLFKRVPVAGSQVRFPVLSALPTAYWVNGDTGQKQTTEEQWSNKFINIEELAVIVPVPENVVADVAAAGGIDLWDEIQPGVEEAIGRALDLAIVLGTNAPATFPKAIVPDAEARGFEVKEGSTVAEGGIQNDIDIAVGETEIVGYDPSGILGNRTLRGKLRRARTTQGQRLDGVNADLTEYMGLKIAYPMRGLWPTGAERVEAIVGDFTEFGLAIRKDISFKLLDQAVIQDNTGAIVLNLAQQDSIAMRFTFRAGWVASNRIRYDQTDEKQRYPVSVLKSAS